MADDDERKTRRAKLVLLKGPAPDASVECKHRRKPGADQGKRMLELIDCRVDLYEKLGSAPGQSTWKRLLTATLDGLRQVSSKLRRPSRSSNENRKRELSARQQVHRIQRRTR